MSGKIKRVSKHFLANGMQETHATNLSTTQAELASSKAETAAAKTEAEAAIKEAGIAGEKKIQRLSERTAKVRSTNMHLHKASGGICNAFPSALKLRAGSMFGMSITHTFWSDLTMATPNHVCPV